MNDSESVGNCECCHANLHGHLGVFDDEFHGVAVITIKETSPRNWICCDACAVMLCHACCSHPESGYCNECISKYGIQVSAQHTSQPGGNHPPQVL